MQSLTHACFELLQLFLGNQVLPRSLFQQTCHLSCHLQSCNLPHYATQNPPACCGLEQCCKAKKGKKIVIIGETCSGDDNDNNFLKVSFQSCLSRFKSKAGRRTNAGALCRLESKSRPKRTKRKAEIPLYYIFIPPSCLSVLMGDNRHLFPVNVSQLTACAAERTRKGLPGVRPWP